MQAAGAASVVGESGTILFASDQVCHLLWYAAGELNGHGVDSSVQRGIALRMLAIAYALRIIATRERWKRALNCLLCARMDPRSEWKLI